MLEDVLLTKRIIALLAYIFGFAAVPIFAKTFSGALGQLLGMVNDKSKGLIDRPRNKLRELSEGRRAGRKDARITAQELGAPDQKKMGRMNPFNPKTWQEGWRKRDRLRTKARTGWESFKAGGTLTPDSPMYKDGPPLNRGELVTRLGGAAALEKAVERQKKAGERAKMFIYGKTFDQLKNTVLDDQEITHVRQAALTKLNEAGMGGHVREILEAGYQKETVQKLEDDALVRVIKTAKANEEFFKGFRDKAADIAKGAFDEENGEITIRQVPKVKFLYDNSPEIAGTAWDASNVGHIMSLPDDYKEKIGGRTMTGAEMKKEILIRNVQEILLSPQLRRKSNQEVLESISRAVYESGDLSEAAKETDSRLLGEIRKPCSKED